VAHPRLAGFNRLASRQGCSPESIRGDFEGLTSAHVYGALALYLDHQADIDAYLAHRREQWAKLERQGTPANPDLQAGLNVPAAASRFFGNEGSVSGGQ